MHRIDLNCDMGESFGLYRLGSDEQMMPHITSANIACGFHAGDPATIRSAVKLALVHGVAIGAHPGLPDLAGFGRRKMEITAQEAYDMTIYQIGAIRAFAESEGGALSHVKPHGALYNMAAKDAALAEAIAEAVYKVDGSLRLYGLSGSELIRAGERIGLTVLNEVFADRAYEEDGSLTPRSIEGAILTSSVRAADQVIRIIKEGQVQTRTGAYIPLKADTVCIHGDTPGATGHAAALREALQDAGIAVQSPGK
ncbi:LamB/YcsF family protein [Paenibacillus nanensis]|uniref:5-oxoprolinase subunit A n=1 Tax=Paenibacillus nanensis TaxID=393251 RepID=A0A3A1VHU0_9BACL|nr:5-oxoprolinase subunit PxpA [Paenibacillus nanensis]RIX60499.1 LamB/YcsF family protein [Paenibacillus nanensis]